MEAPFDPPINHFVIFSGGGGLVERVGTIDLEAGENRLHVRGVPASFDPESFTVDIAGATLKEIVLRVPNRQYVEDNLKREGAAARRLIEQSVDIGAQRGQIIELCESVALRTYLDEEVELTLWIVAGATGPAKVALSYFVNDGRFRWKPTITVELGPNDTARVRGYVAITNESAHRLAEVEISFADFARDLGTEGQDAQSYRAPPEEMRARLKAQVVKNMMLK
jgi:hypothetical protein